MPKATVKKQPTWKIYTVISVIVVSLFLGTGLMALWAEYPTENHREVARSQQEIADNNGGWLNTAVYDSKGYRALADRAEAKQTKMVKSIYDVVQVLMYVTVIILVYRYIHRRKLTVSSRTTILATVITVTVGNFLATLLLSLVGYLVSGYRIDYGDSIWQLYAVGFLNSLAFTLFVTWLVALISNRKQSK